LVFGKNNSNSFQNLQGSYGANFKKLECSNSTPVVLFDVCKLKLIRGKMGKVSLGYTFLSEPAKIMVCST
jgi:hypothetical protein